MIKKLSFAATLIFVGLLWRAYTPSIPAEILNSKYTNEHSEFISDGNGMRVHFRDQGLKNGKVIVMLHGNSNSLHYFEPLLALLTSDYRIITLDFPGHGLTGAHPKNQYGYDGLSEALDLIKRELSLDDFALLGHSMGGWVAWRYTVDNPDLVNSLILISASGMPPRADDPQRDVGLGFRLLQSPIGPLLSAYTIPRIMIEKSMNKSVFQTLTTQDAIIDQSWELLRHPENRTALAYRASESREHQKAHLAKLIHQPTLLIWGEEDTFVLPSAALSFADRIVDAKTKLLPEVGHLPVLEATEEVAGLIGEFVAK